MKVHVAKQEQNLPLIDLLRNDNQIFQQEPPKISKFLSSEAQADCYLIPHDASHWTSHYRTYVERLSQHKPLLFFNRFDIPRQIEISNAIAIQTSSISPLKMKTIIVPYNVKALSSRQYRTYAALPKISFVGFVPKIGARRLIRSLQRDPLHPLRNNSAFIRKCGIREITKAFPSASIIERSHYGGARSLISQVDSFRREYEESIYSSDLIFTPRGDANASQRYFETLSAGRVPIVPDTTILFPRTLGRGNPIAISCCYNSTDVYEQVMKFWTQLTKSTYREIQFFNREFFLNKLDYSTYIQQLLKYDFNFILDNFSY